MKNKFLTMYRLRLLYLMARIRTKPTKKHNTMFMSEDDFEKAMVEVDKAKLELGLL